MTMLSNLIKEDFFCSFNFLTSKIILFFHLVDPKLFAKYLKNTKMKTKCRTRKMIVGILKTFDGGNKKNSYEDIKIEK